MNLNILHKGLSAEHSTSIQTESKMIDAVQKRSTGSIILQVAVGLLTGGIGAIGLEIYHQFTKRSQTNEFANMAGTMLTGMQGMPDAESGFSVEYQGSNLEVRPYGHDIRISYGDQTQTLQNQTMEGLRENLKRNILSDIAIFGKENAILALQDETPHTRSLAKDFLQKHMGVEDFDHLATPDLITTCTILLRAEEIDKGEIIETVKTVLWGNDDPRSQVIDKESLELIEAWERDLEANQKKVVHMNDIANANIINMMPADQAQTGIGAEPDDEMKVHDLEAKISDKQPVAVENARITDINGASRASQTPEETQMRNLIAGILLPENIWETDTRSADENLRAVLMQNSGLLARIYANPELIDSAGLPDEPARMMKDSITGFINMIPFASDVVTGDMVRTTLEIMPSGPFARLAAQIDHNLQNMSFNSLQGADLLATINKVGDGNLEKFLTNVLNNYFDNQHVVDKRAMLASYMRESGANDPDETKLVALLKAGGPYLQKLLQLLGDNAEGQLKTALDELKTNLSPINRTVIDATLLGMVARSEGKIDRVEVNCSLGAASVGQALLVNIYLKGSDEPQEAVVKILRPGIRLRAERELQFFEAEASKIPGMLKTFNGIADQVQVELDLEKEAKNVAHSQVYNNMAGNLQTMKLFSGIQATHTYMVLEKAPGTTAKATLTELEKQKENLSIAKQNNAVEMGAKLAEGFRSLTKAWVQEALFGSGFYHGDLHAGNIMFSADAKESGLITTIDMGNACVLSSQQRKAIFKMVLATAVRDPHVFVKNYEAVLSDEGKNQIVTKRAELLDKTREIMREAADPSEAISQILAAANRLGLEIPATVSNFSRSQMMLQNALNTINEHNHEIKALIEPRLSVREHLLQASSKATNEDDKAQLARDAEKLISAQEAEWAKHLEPMDFGQLIKEVVMNNFTTALSLARGSIFSLGSAGIWGSDLTSSQSEPGQDTGLSSNPPLGAQMA